MSNEEQSQQELDNEISKWRNSKDNEPLIIEFDNGEKFIFLKSVA